MKKHIQLIILSILICINLPLFSAVPNKSVIEARLFKNESGHTMPYRLLKPTNYDSRKKYPLVLCLHGAGGRGTENKSKGTEAFTALSKTTIQNTFPSFLLTPQCPKNKQWVNTPWKDGSYSIANTSVSKELHLALQILDAVEEEFNIDTERIYVTGQSMGGYATWDIILRYPKRFAAAIPICGAGDPSAAKKIAHIPIHVFHGDKDTVVPTIGSQEMVKALKKFGSNVKYTEYNGVGHNSWSKAWKEKDLISWLFKQRIQIN